MAGLGAQRVRPADAARAMRYVVHKRGVLQVDSMARYSPHQSSKVDPVQRRSANFEPRGLRAALFVAQKFSYVTTTYNNDVAIRADLTTGCVNGDAKTRCTALICVFYKSDVTGAAPPQPIAEPQVKKFFFMRHNCVCHVLKKAPCKINQSVNRFCVLGGREGADRGPTDSQTMQ